jgi:hypothetical protein
VPGVRGLILLIPQGLTLPGPLTGLLAGLLVVSLGARRRIGTGLLREIFRIGLAGLPAGLALLLIFQWWFVVRLPIEGGNAMVSVIIAPPRTPDCPCKGLQDDECVEQLAHPDFIAKCWGRRAVHFNEALWSGAYLLAVGGLCCGIGFLRLRGEAPDMRPSPEAAVPPAAVPERRIFLSYSRQDADFVERLGRDLIEKGIAVWKDTEELGVADSLPQEIGKAIEGSTWFGSVLSPSALASRWAGLELDIAMALEVETGSPRVLPILHRSCPIPALVRNKIYADFTTSYEGGLAVLLRELEV